MRKLDDIRHEGGRDGFLNDILRLDFLADQVYGGAGLLQDFLIEFYRPLGVELFKFRIKTFIEFIINIFENVMAL